MCKYLSFNVMKYIQFEILTKLNKNAYKKITLIFIIFQLVSIKIIHSIDFNMLENKTIILEINNTK